MWSPFGSYTIHNGTDPYLTRYYLTPRRQARKRSGKSAWWPGVFLHHFHRSDADRASHNHPWRWSISFILRGGYIEHRYSRITHQWTSRVVKPFSFNIIRADDFHRVDLLDPVNGCWSLFVAFKHKQAKRGSEWGFVDPDTNRFQGWREYLGIGTDGLESD